MGDVEKAQNRRKKHKILVYVCGVGALALMAAAPALHGHLVAQFCHDVPSAAASASHPVSGLMCDLVSSIGVRWAFLGLAFAPMAFAMTYSFWFAWQDHTCGWFDLES